MRMIVVLVLGDAQNPERPTGDKPELFYDLAAQ